MSRRIKLTGGGIDARLSESNHDPNHGSFALCMAQRVCPQARGGGGGGELQYETDSSEILNLTPKGDHLGVAQGFCDP